MQSDVIKTSQNSTAPNSHPIQTSKMRVKNEKQMLEFHPLTSPDRFVIWESLMVIKWSKQGSVVVFSNKYQEIRVSSLLMPNNAANNKNPP